MIYKSPPAPSRGNNKYLRVRCLWQLTLKLLMGILFMGSSVNAAEPYMPPFKDYMFLFVHGVNSDQYTWFSPDKNGKPREDGDTNKWWNYIHQSLGVSKYHMAQYSFSEASGSHEVNMLEFGNGGYVNQASKPDSGNNKGELELANGTKIPKTTGIADNRSWLEQARAEYKQALYSDTQINKEDSVSRKKIWEFPKDIPDALLPSKLVVVGHSQANYAIRGYIQSGALARERDFFQDGEVVPDYLLSEVGKRKIQENPLGFYDWPVEKVVFINPPLKGSDMAWVLVYGGVTLV